MLGQVTLVYSLAYDRYNRYTVQQLKKGEKTIFRLEKGGEVFFSETWPRNLLNFNRSLTNYFRLMLGKIERG